MTPPPLVLAIDPSPRGFGYAVLEGTTRLVDWGLVHVAAARKNEQSLRRLRDLLALYQPQVVAMEDCASPRCRRRARARALIRDVAKVARSDGMEIVVITWEQIRRAVRVATDANKEATIVALSHFFPELGDRVPPHRKPWMSEDPRTSIFDAVAIAVAASLPKGGRVAPVGQQCLDADTV